MSKPDNFQLQSAQALRQLALAIEQGTMTITAVNHGLLDGRFSVAFHASSGSVELWPPTITDWGRLKFLCHRLPPLPE